MILPFGVLFRTLRRQNNKNIESMKNIPDIVKIAAQNKGFNSVEYEGEVDGAKVYSVGIIDKDGTPVPLGMPSYLLLKDDEVSMTSGKDGFNLMFRL